MANFCKKSQILRGGAQQKKSRQSGRSMIEMLGVLAIIGVLSIGSISAYSRAMLRYRLNRQYEQLHMIMTAIEKIGNTFMSLPQTTSLTKTFVNLNEVPSEMVVDGSNYLKDIFGLNWYIYYIYDTSSNLKDISLTSYSGQLFPKNKNTLEICHNVVKLAQAHHDTVLYISAGSGWGAGDEHVGVTFYGDRSCLSWRKCLRDMTLDDINELCNKHSKSDAEFKITW